MGKAKALLEWKGKKLIDWQIEKAKLLCHENVYVVIGAQINDMEEFEGVEVIINEEWEKGISTSIKKGIAHISEIKSIRSVLISLVDQPLIPLSHYKKMIEVFNSCNKEIVATSFNEVAVVPVIFSASYFPQLQKLEGDIGARKLIRDNITNCSLVESTFPYIDLDTMKEYKEFLRSNK